MAHDTLTLALNGTVPLKAFALAMDDFTKLIEALSDEVAGPNVQIAWEICHLESGSAITSIRGSYQEYRDRDNAADEIDGYETDLVAQIVKAYEVVGRALEQQAPIPYSAEVAYYAGRLTGVINGPIQSIEFMTDNFRALVSEQRVKPEPRPKSIGLITGIVWTVTERQHPPAIRLTVLAPLSRELVFCYLNKSQAELARVVLFERVSVLGLIYRDPTTGRAIDVHEITKIELAADHGQPFSYRQARGSVPWREGDEPSEVLLRRLRDGN